jgi:hypothetical protein
MVSGNVPGSRSLILQRSAIPLAVTSGLEIKTPRETFLFQFPHRAAEYGTIWSVKGASPQPRIASGLESLGDLKMKFLNPKFAASACLFTMLAAPVAVLADRDRGGKDKNRYAVPEPSTLAMTVIGLGLGLGLVVAGLRRNRSASAA